MTEVLFVAYFLVLIASLLIKTPIIKGPWLFLMRAFFPNWKFFHAVGYVPHLYARSAVMQSSGELHWFDWVLIYPRHTRSLIHLIHNPDTNLGLGQQNLVDHFWADLYDLPEGNDPRQLVTYQMVSRLVSLVLRERDFNFTHSQFELRMALDDRTQTIDTYVMMTSPVVESLKTAEVKAEEKIPSVSKTGTAE
jgi:hypothetical protein